MADFGRYRISYEPGPFDPYSGVLEHAVEMSISGQASIEQMLSFFDAFLKANGYVYDGDVQIVKGEEVFDKKYWQDKYLDLLRTPPETASPYYVTCQGSQGVDFVPFSHSMVDDVFTSGLE
jgi:hypothetical protein